MRNVDAVVKASGIDAWDTKDLVWKAGGSKSGTYPRIQIQNLAKQQNVASPKSWFGELTISAWFQHENIASKGSNTPFSYSTTQATFQFQEKQQRVPLVQH